MRSHLAIVGKFDQMRSTFEQMRYAIGQMRAHLAKCTDWSNAPYNTALKSATHYI